MSDEDHGFKSPIHPQNQSLLMRLPAELRVPIYRQLLVHDDCFREGNKALEYLQPQVLRVCQALYHEALPLWRSKNSFAIDINLARYNIPSEPGNITVRFPAGDGRWEENTRLTEVVASPSNQWVMRITSRLQLTLHLPTLDVGHDHLRWRLVERLEDSLRLIRPYVKECEVTVIYADLRGENHLLKLINKDRIVARSFLYIFELIRCKRLIFSGIQPSRFEHIQGICESADPIVDLPLDAGRAWRHLEECVRAVRRSPSEQDMAYGVALGNAARRYIPSDYGPAKARVLEKAGQYQRMRLIQEYGSRVQAGPSSQ